MHELIPDAQNASTAPGVVAQAPLPKALWLGAGAVALTIAGLASALAWRGAPTDAPALVADAGKPADTARAAARPAAKPPAAKSVTQAPACAGCGTVVTVQALQQQGQATGLGAVAGGVIGGVVGNQLGGGNGRKALTVLGAVGGGVAGHEIEKNARATTVYSVKVRLDDGTLRTLQLQQAPAVGARVQVDGPNLRTV